MMGEPSAKTENPLDPALFRAEAISEETRRFNEEIVKLLTPMPNWWEVGDAFPIAIAEQANARRDAFLARETI